MDAALQQLREITTKLQDTEDRLFLALQATEFGVWDWYIKEDRLVWDTKMLEICDVSREEFAGNFKLFEQLIHPADKLKVKKYIKQAIEITGIIDHSYRIRNKQNIYSMVSTRGKVMKDINGEPYRMIGVAWKAAKNTGYTPIEDDTTKLFTKQYAL